MKNLKIKNLILTAALAVGLGVTGISATAQAAEGRGVFSDGCEHSKDNWTLEDTIVSYDTRDNNRFTHTIYFLDIYTCNICHKIITEDDEMQQPHNLVFSSTGNRWECTYCDYWE